MNQLTARGLKNAFFSKGHAPILREYICEFIDPMRECTMAHFLLCTRMHICISLSVFICIWAGNSDSLYTFWSEIRKKVIYQFKSRTDLQCLMTVFWWCYHQFHIIKIQLKITVWMSLLFATKYVAYKATHSNYRPRIRWWCYFGIIKSLIELWSIYTFHIRL